jgi:hypothetical protein
MAYVAGYPVRCKWGHLLPGMVCPAAGQAFEQAGNNHFRTWCGIYFK